MRAEAMDLLHFIGNIGCALVLGVLIGLERQYRQHPAGLRTNALVCMGAALFVSLSFLMMTIDKSIDPTRIASYVVSGVGFLGGGVILREGLNVRGMSTAATLWCSAAVGSLAGAGFPLHAALATAAVLAVHLGLRPVALWIDKRQQKAVNVETTYRLQVVCSQAQEVVIRSILMRHVNSKESMHLQGIAIRDAEQPDHTAVVADIYSTIRNDKAMEELVSRINIEPSVTSVRWERLA
jgi:putative Mg2+ transporter-C (MgtC) family protein